MTSGELSRPRRRLRVAVLMGGASSEREVSLVSGRMILEGLDRNRYEVMALDTRDLLRVTGGTPQQIAGPSETRLQEALSRREDSVSTSCASLEGADAGAKDRPDVVFIALHGKGGEDGTVQGMLEFLGIPYTGSGVLASALAMDKVMSKRLYKAAGIPVVEGLYITRSSMAACSSETFQTGSMRDVDRLLGYPVFVKPNAGGSTLGCTLVPAANQLFDAVIKALEFDEVVLVEKYAAGMEITIGVLDSVHGEAEALPVIEIVPRNEFYDYESKYQEGGSDHIIPARLPEAQLRRVQEIARECHALLGCRGMSRTDIIVTDEGPFVLEVNTIPGMTPTSLLPQAAAHAGISFSQLLDRIIQCATDPC